MTEEDRQTILGVGGKLIESLRSSPALLALIVLNLILMAAIFWSVRQERQLSFELTKMNQNITSDVLQLLSACQQRGT